MDASNFGAVIASDGFHYGDVGYAHDPLRSSCCDHLDNGTYGKETIWQSSLGSQLLVQQFSNSSLYSYRNFQQ